MILLANKVDLIEKYGERSKFMSEEFLDKFSVENQFLRSFRTSAKINTNVDEAFFCLIEEILKHSTTTEQNFNSFAKSNITLKRAKNPYQQKKSKCCK
jgi:hypothetical protein